MDIWAWGHPLGLGVFIVAVTLSIALLSLAGKWSGDINRRKR